MKMLVWINNSVCRLYYLWSFSVYLCNKW